MTSSEQWISIEDETSYFWKNHFFEYQDTQNDCAHSCLSMVTSIFGKKVPKNWFRTYFPPHLGGVSILELKRMTQKVHIESEAFQCEWDELKDLQTPLILYYENHFVLLSKQKNNGHLVIANPASGVTAYDEKTPPAEWSGIGLVLTVTDKFFEPTFPKVEKQLNYKAFLGHIRFPLALLIFSLLPTLLYWAEGHLFHQIVGQLFGSSSVNDHAGKLFLVVLILEVAKEFSNFISFFSLLKSAAIFDLKVGIEFLDNLFKMGFDRFQGFKYGDIDLIFDELGTLRKFMLGSSLKIFGALVMTIVLSLSAWALNPLLFIIPFISTTIAWLILFPLRNKTLSLNQAEFITREQFSTMSRNYFSTIDLLSRFRLKRRVINEITNSYDKNLNANNSIRKTETSIILISGSIRVISEIAIMLSLLTSHLNGFMSAADMILGYWLSIGILGSLITIITVLLNYARLRLTFSRIGLIVRPENDIITQRPESLSQYYPLSLNHLCFSYITDHELLALDNINITIDGPGIYGIFGKSGSGKSTLGLILAGLQKPLSGSISVANNEINEHHLLQSVSYVFQDEGLFQKSLKENISLSEEDISSEKMASATFVSTLDSVIENKQDFNINALSEGQKQRILLARAIYRNRKIIVLDEGTHSLDTQTEQLFVERIKTNYPDTILIIISHRHSTMQLCQKIFILDKGHLSKQGNPLEMRPEDFILQDRIE
jgi:ABC-type bacteriocin/lantibiotic exporter with double-glycine peptidase domain